MRLLETSVGNVWCSLFYQDREATQSLALEAA